MIKYIHEGSVIQVILIFKCLIGSNWTSYLIQRSFASYPKSFR